MNYILLAFGLLILIKGADVLVSSTSFIAKHFKIPTFIIGLVVVSIGTSAPEAAIGIFSAFSKNNTLTLGDIIGSSILNIALVIGITAMVRPLKVQSRVPKRELPLSILIQLILVFFLFTGSILSRWEALILIIGFGFFMFYIVRNAKNMAENKSPKSSSEAEVYNFMEDESLFSEDEETSSAQDKTVLPKKILGFLIGLIGLILGANLATSSAVSIAEHFGFSEAFIGLTLVAFGTSLPELVTCLLAVMKGEEDIAVGNIIGSNIFNVLFALGVSSFIHPIPSSGTIMIDSLFMLGASAMLFIPTYFKNRISKLSGFLFLSYYIIFITLKISVIGLS